ncbi:MAG: flavodoxin family protein [Candidatus Zixiibacteriota bacterium]|nr:MAG: flavodoxin family protein [candidate division Zixibacteria bacterium]
MKLLIVNGSPRVGSSTEILARQFEDGFTSIHPNAEVVNVRLNDLSIIPCQACGIDPTPLPCVYKDDLYPTLQHLTQADMVLIASPVYFDTVSAQTKLFIDRSNCFRPPHFRNNTVEFDDHGILRSKGAYILVGGAREKFDAAERVIGGFFIWAGIEKLGKVIHSHDDWRLGGVLLNPETLRQSHDLGVSSASSMS